MQIKDKLTWTRSILNGELSDPLCGSDFSRRIETFSKILFQKIKFNCNIIQHIVSLETVLLKYKVSYLIQTIRKIISEIFKCNLKLEHCCRPGCDQKDTHCDRNGWLYMRYINNTNMQNVCTKSLVMCSGHRGNTVDNQQQGKKTSSGIHMFVVRMQRHDWLAKVRATQI